MRLEELLNKQVSLINTPYIQLLYILLTGGLTDRGPSGRPGMSGRVPMGQQLWARPHNQFTMGTRRGGLLGLVMMLKKCLMQSFFSYMYMHMQTLRELAELLIGRLPIWSCDREVAIATLLFTTHCTQCIESICSENIPTTLQTRVGASLMNQRPSWGRSFPKKGADSSD